MSIEPKLTMKEHWQAGYKDAELTLRHPKILERPTNSEGVSSFDLLKEGRQ
ncbi:MAG: DUF3734 domain-containing protein [Acidocella sp.]|uniref:DUF3734 domain-containing protein n=1 Tax=Acidocella sp. TaxID=50710 RepID=UPI003FD7F8A0